MATTNDAAATREAVLQVHMVLTTPLYRQTEKVYFRLCVYTDPAFLVSLCMCIYIYIYTDPAPLLSDPAIDVFSDKLENPGDDASDDVKVILRQCLGRRNTIMITPATKVLHPPLYQKECYHCLANKGN